MTALLLAVLVASLLGSAHCAGMCGCFALLAARDGGPGASTGSLGRSVAAYHGARGAAYVVLGVVAGALGAALDFGGAWVGWQRAAAIAAGASLVLIGGFSLLRVSGVRIGFSRSKRTAGGTSKLGAGLRRFVTAGHRFAARFRGSRRAAWIGALSALLPCGWLYAFLVTAAGTGSPIRGGLVMLAFFAGTVPVLALIGCGGATLAGAGTAGGGASRAARVRGWVRPVRIAASITVIALGIGMAAARASLPLDRFELEGTREEIDLEEEASRVEGLDPESMPCCHGD